MSSNGNSYEAPEFNITRDKQFDRVKPTSSALFFAQFVAKSRMYVTNIIVGVRSVASVAAQTAFVGHKISLNVAFSAVAGSTMAWISATSVGSYQTIALNRTLAAQECLGIGFTDPSGEYHVMYEYQILPTYS